MEPRIEHVMKCLKENCGPCDDVSQRDLATALLAEFKAHEKVAAEAKFLRVDHEFMQKRIREDQVLERTAWLAKEADRLGRRVAELEAEEQTWNQAYNKVAKALKRTQGVCRVVVTNLSHINTNEALEALKEADAVLGGHDAEG